MGRRRWSPLRYALCLHTRSQHPSREGAETRAAPIHNCSPQKIAVINYYELISGIGSETSAPS